MANIYLARLDRGLDAEGVTCVRYADDVRLASRTPSGARHALTRAAEGLAGLGLRLNPQKTQRVSIHQGVPFLGYLLIQVKGHLNAFIPPKALVRFRARVRELTRRTAGLKLPVLVARLNEYLRGWGAYFKRAQCSGVLDRLDRWVARRVRAYVAKRWRHALWRRYPDPYLYGTLRLTRLYALRRDFLRERAARHGRQPLCRA